MTGTTITLERNARIILASPAELLAPDREIAWASGLIRPNPLYAWVVGRFVSAGPANANGHIFRAEDLRTAGASLSHAPLNYLHRPQHVLGAYAGAELVYPTDGPAKAADAQPFVESLAAMWRYYFPEEYARIRAFHQAGQLAQSMECIPKTVTCATEGCGQEFAYAGRVSDTYCAHLAPGTRGTPPRWLNKPHFSAGAIVVPPATPAWRGAQVTEVLAARTEQLRSAEAEGLADDLYAQVAAALPNLAENDRETVMALLMARTGPAGAAGKGERRPPRPPASPAATPAADEPHAHVDTDPEKTDSPCAICGKAPESPIHVGMGMMGSVEDGTAAMVALYPPRAVATALNAGAVLPDALPVEDMHITLAYLGPEAVLHLDRAAVAAVLGPLAGASAPMEGSVSGVGRFSAGYPAGQDPWPLYASVDVPDLPEFRQRLVAALDAAGIPYARNHGFTPHMTLAYVGPEDETAAAHILAAGVEPVPVTFGEIVLAWGADRIGFALSAGAQDEDLSAAAVEAVARVEATAAAQGLRADVADITARARREAAAIPVYDPVIGRAFTGDQREKLARMGHAMADGFFPIENVGDLRSAIRAAGRAKDPVAARAHIRRRAKALGAGNLIPDGW